MSTKRNSNRSTRRKRRLILLPLIYILLLLSAVLIVASVYKSKAFGDSQIDEIVFYISTGLADGQSGSIVDAVRDNVLFAGILFFVLLLPVVDFYRDKIRVHFDMSLFGRARTINFNPSRIPLWFKITYASIVFVISLAILLQSFGVFSYLKSLTEKSTLYEEHYVDPKTAKLEFPDKKRNLIYIYLESMENTNASRVHGGQTEQSTIPELESLALDPRNVSFSHTSSGLGGALPAQGTTWTVGGMIAQSSGIPLKVNVMGDTQNSMDKVNKFLPGAYTLGDILKTNGYNQTFIMGSRASFGGRDKLLTQHGSYQIQDYAYAQESGMIAPDYGVWWGYEDKKLFSFAKEELTRLSGLDVPFNLQLLTVDTHFTDGYMDETCTQSFEAQYANVHACSSKQVGEFLSWVRKQPFYENTTIVLSGDHLGMQTGYYDELITTPDYQRTIYNVFINPAVRPAKQFERQFSTMDMYPSTLAAMGVRIPNDRLGLGTNLFADKQTLVEQYGGIDQLNQELSKRSTYYDRKILMN